MSTGYILYVIMYYVQSIPIYIYAYRTSVLYAIYIFYIGIFDGLCATNQPIFAF